MIKNIKLEVGKSYYDLTGAVVEIVRKSPDEYLFYDSKNTAFLCNGEYHNCDRTCWDLARETE